MILCLLTVTASTLAADHSIQAWLEILLDIFAERLTTILRLFTSMKSSFSITQTMEYVKKWHS